jgi:hypothetical protein
MTCKAPSCRRLTAIMNDESAPKGAHEITAKRSDDSLELGTDVVPETRPWYGRKDAHAVEIRYRRSVYYWRRRAACDRHGRRAEHECTT